MNYMVECGAMSEVKTACIILQELGHNAKMKNVNGSTFPYVMTYRLFGDDSHKVVKFQEFYNNTDKYFTLKEKVKTTRTANSDINKVYPNEKGYQGG